MKHPFRTFPMKFASIWFCTLRFPPPFVFPSGGVLVIFAPLFLTFRLSSVENYESSLLSTFCFFDWWIVFSPSTLLCFVWHPYPRKSRDHCFEEVRRLEKIVPNRRLGVDCFRMFSTGRKIGLGSFHSMVELGRAWDGISPLFLWGMHVCPIFTECWGTISTVSLMSYFTRSCSTSTLQKITVYLLVLRW